MKPIPGDTRVAIERLLTYISDIGTITSYLQIPREWVEHTQRNSVAKHRRILDRGCGKAIGGSDGRPTQSERINDKAIARSSDRLAEEYAKVYRHYTLICGASTHFIAGHLMNCSCPVKAIANEREEADGKRRKEFKK